MRIPSMSRSMKLMAGGLLVALAGSLALTSVSAHQGRDEGAMQQRHGAGAHGPMGPMGPLGLAGLLMAPPERSEGMLNRMLDDLKASDAQRTQLRQIVKSAAEDLQKQREAGRDLRRQSQQLFVQPEIDADKAEALRQQMLQQHDQSSKRVLQAMLDFSRALTPEQRSQLAERMQRFEERRRERHDRHERRDGAPEGSRS